MSTVAPPRPSLRAPARVVVRQHRWALMITGALALLTAVGLVAVTLRSSQVAEAFAATGCPADGGAGRACDVTARSYQDSMSLYRGILDNLTLALRALPVAAAAFVAGPLIARELESGTFRLAWTQSVSPARWLAAKLAVPTALLLAGTAVLTALLHWARARADIPYLPGWADAPVFATTGTVPLAHLLFGICAGTLIALLVRRTLLALTLSGLVSGVVITAFAYLRGGLWPRDTLTGRSLEVVEEIWWVETGQLTSSGERLSSDVCGQIMPEADLTRCLADHDITGRYLDYHPASHFWPVQLVETGILLALAALAVTLAFRVLRRRTG
ncbi:hypothetical protein [Streptomyces sp. NPDC056796]|uniref:hypothetical protein n=1 Tax=Streptomyces sp. NPDC056796 TaxID=3345947 RepID=UPI0036833BB9